MLKVLVSVSVLVSVESIWVSVSDLNQNSGFGHTLLEIEDYVADRKLYSQGCLHQKLSSDKTLTKCIFVQFCTKVRVLTLIPMPVVICPIKKTA